MPELKLIDSENVGDYFAEKYSLENIDAAIKSGRKDELVGNINSDVSQVSSISLNTESGMKLQLQKCSDDFDTISKELDESKIRSMTKTEHSYYQIKTGIISARADLLFKRIELSGKDPF